jgi:hypothetical protein
MPDFIIQAYWCCVSALVHPDDRGEDHCGWDEFIDGGKPDEEADGYIKKCPRCGSEVTAQHYAV